MPTKQTAQLWDLDGVVVDSVRDEFILDFIKKDFTRFESLIPEFDSFEWAVDTIRAMNRKHKIVFLTARNESYREPTEQWIQQKLLLKPEQYELYMRKPRDDRPDTQVKAELLPKILRKYEVLVAYDDKLDNCRLYGYHGIIACHVRSGGKHL